MKYHQIEAFYQVMLTGSISQAAVNLGRTQPAVSMTINTLENLLGARLFDRHAGRISPRSEAHVLFEQVGPVMRQLHDIRSRFTRLSSFAVPRLSIISASNPGMHIIPSAIAPVAAAGQDFQLMTGSAATIVSEIENQRHDIGLTDQGPTEIRMNSPLFEVEVFEIPVLALFPRGMVPGTGGDITTGQIAEHPICTLYAQHGMAADIRARLPAPRVEFDSFFPMACYAMANASVAIVDALTCASIQALTRGVFSPEYLPIRDAQPAKYYLLRPTYRARSMMADNAYAAVRTTLKEYRAPHKSD